MNKKIIFFALTFLFLFSYKGFSQTADEVIENYITATGGLDVITAVQSYEIKGNMKMGSMDIPFTIYLKRPMKALLEVIYQGMTMKQAYDGTIAWTINPFAGSEDPEKMDKGQTKRMQSMADMDGALVNYKEKGSTVELIGKEDFEGTEVYNIKLIDKNGDQINYYIDAESYMILKEASKTKMEEKEVKSETMFSDYRDINGIMLSFAMVVESDANPMGTQNIVMEEFKQNVDIDDNIFVMPKDDDKDDDKDDNDDDDTDDVDDKD